MNYQNLLDKSKTTTIDNSSENDDDKPTHINNSNKGMLETV